MSLRFIDGVGHYASGDILTKYTVGNVTFVSVQSTAGRRSNPCLEFAANSAWIGKTLDAQATWIVGFAFKMKTPFTGGAICTLFDGALPQVYITVNNDGTLSAYRYNNGFNATLLGTSTYALSAGTWHYLEVKFTINNTTGVVTVKVDGTQRLNLTGQNTRSTSNNSGNVIGFAYNGNSAATTFDIGDIYICDTAGSANNDFLGDCRVDAYRPNGAGNYSGMSPSAGSNYQCVDDTTPNGDSDYVSSATATTKDTYAFSDMSHNPSSIFGVQTLIAAKKSDAGIRSMKRLVRRSATDYAGSAQVVASSYLFAQEILETDPATSAAWTQTNFNAAEFGVEVA